MMSKEMDGDEPFIYRLNDNGSGPSLLVKFMNHIPKGGSICRKDSLSRLLRCMRRIHGSIYDFRYVYYLHHHVWIYVRT
ncbi:unnamed protein product [Leptidea sinapis]|uniref:Uncharacterized protein n=1 Tax=Leptidea sinapis TaxID=189913 RepID=A0A5E4Q3W8_9NEOP|nr:unnamed protein product [Leptidea sinapis]